MLGTFYFIILRAYLTVMEAVILILKHTTFLHISNPSQKSALTQAEKDYQAANIDMKIQEFLTPSSQEVSVEKLAQFIMANDLGLLILAPIININSPKLFLEHNGWLKRFWKQTFLHKSIKQHKKGPISGGSGVASGSGTSGSGV